MQFRNLQTACGGLSAYTVPFAAETSKHGRESVQMCMLRQGADTNVTADMIAVFMQVRNLQSSRMLRKVLQCTWTLQPSDDVWTKSCIFVALSQPGRTILSQVRFVLKEGTIHLARGHHSPCKAVRTQSAERNPLTPTMRELTVCCMPDPAKEASVTARVQAPHIKDCKGGP